MTECIIDGMDEKSSEILAGELLKNRGLRLAVAESCTGGLVGHRLTNVPGSSAYFVGGVMAYANQAKEQFLGVQPATLERYGAVSRETVLEMARGARLGFQADIGLSTSGVAGPDGGTPEKPVGTVWVGLSTAGAEQAWLFHWQGDRLAIKEQTTTALLQLLVEYLVRLPAGGPPSG